MNSFHEEVYRITSQVPPGKVTSYGRIAAIMGKPRAARTVGYVLSALRKEIEHSIPWQRVINSQGKISFKGDNLRANLQKELLLQEGVEFDKSEKVDMQVFGWP